MPPSLNQMQDRQAQRCLAVLHHTEEVTGNVAQTRRYYGITRQTFYKWLRRYQDEGIRDCEQPGDQDAKVLVGEAGCGEQRLAEGAGQIHNPRIAEP